MHKLIAIYWQGAGISFHRNWDEAARYKATTTGSAGSTYDIPVTKWLHDKVHRHGDWMSGMRDRREALNYCPVSDLIAKCKTDACLLVE